MPIHVLDKKTIDKIAAGEVVERPFSVVKELVENALDAGATAISVEIKNGGKDLIRVTDNGSGIPKDEVRTAFLPHATSKIRDEEDLYSILSLGFRGEALPSIAAVSRLEVITRTKDELSGVSYVLHGGEEQSFEEIGAPEGTTFLVKDLFYNTPARLKFLRSAAQEGSSTASLIEHMALSHPYVSFRLTVNGKTVLSTSGSGKVRDLIFAVYGRDAAKEVIPIDYEDDVLKVSGFLGKPVMAKGNRSFENYFINGRYVKSRIIEMACEEAFAPFMMQHMYPFLVLYITMPASAYDVNVHPAKTELRFLDEAGVSESIYKAVSLTLSGKEMIQEDEEKPPEEKKPAVNIPEPFETLRLREETRPYEGTKEDPVKNIFNRFLAERTEKESEEPGFLQEEDLSKEEPAATVLKPDKEDEFRGQFLEQMDLFETRLISDEGMKKHRLIGQVFDTYWLMQMEDKLFIMDQHAAHEKVLYERKMKSLKERTPVSQQLSPPVMVSLSREEEQLLNRYEQAFRDFGYEISHFGGREYALTAVPDDVYGLEIRPLFLETLADMGDDMPERTPAMILDRVAMASCKAAVKGRERLSFEEAEALLQELLTLDNPYACPHGRPTLISMTRKELEKRFKRIV